MSNEKKLVVWGYITFVLFKVMGLITIKPPFGDIFLFFSDHPREIKYYMLSFLGHDEIENLGFPMKLLGGGFISHLRSTNQNEKLPQFSDIEFKKFIQTHDRPDMF